MRLPRLPSRLGICAWTTISRVSRTEQRARRMPRRQTPRSFRSLSHRPRKRDPRAPGCFALPLSVSAPYACTIALSSLPCRAHRRAL
ncbi:hypothetical protein SBADM41S_10758 [Streptomyces badius]